MITDSHHKPLTSRSAGELAQLVRKAEISPVEIIRSSLDRIDEINPRLNAFTDIYRDEALALAKTAEATMRSGETLGPLHGIPVAIKDLTPVINYSGSYHGIVVPAESSWKSLNDLLADAKAKPGVLTFATAGTFDGAHFAMLVISRLKDLKFVHVPFQGGPTAMAALLVREPRGASHGETRSERAARRVYEPLLRWSVARPAAIAASAVAAFVAGIFAFLMLGREFIPTLDEGDALVQALRIPSTSLEQSQAMQFRVENTLKAIPEVETVFLQPAGRYSFVSSRMIKEVFSFGGDVTGLLPPNVLKRLKSRINGG